MNDPNGPARAGCRPDSPAGDPAGHAAGHVAGHPGGAPAEVHIDCATCPARGVSCDDCVVTVLLGPPLLDETVTAAIAVLADHGLVPPLRDPRDPGSRRVG